VEKDMAIQVGGGGGSGGGGWRAGGRAAGMCWGERREQGAVCMCGWWGHGRGASKQHMLQFTCDKQGALLALVRPLNLNPAHHL
jgi:hypothetical protein